MAIRFPWAHARWIKMGLDVGAGVLAVPLAFWLRLDQESLAYADAVVALSALAVPLFAVAAYALGLHRQSWGFVSGADVRRVVAAVGLTSVGLFAGAWILQAYIPVPRSVALIAGALSLVALAGMRLAVRTWRERRDRTASDVRRVIILGAGESGLSLARDLRTNRASGFDPVAFLDDDPGLQGLSRQGVPVLGPLSALADAARAMRADEALFAIPNAAMGVRRGVFEIADRAGIPVRAVPSVHDLLSSRSPSQLRDVLQHLVDDAAGRNVLLVGGAGYIGSALVPLLLEAGYRVRVLDLLIYGDAPIRRFIDHPNFTLIQGDFRQVDKVVESLQGIDTVVHLGGLVGDPACALDEDLTVEINLMATKMIAEVAKGYGVSRFVFASTCSVYGEMDGLLTEESPVNPISLYARTKVASEKVLLKMADQGFAPTILRFGTVYGFSGRTRFDLVVNLLTAKAVTEGVITLYGGDQWRPFIHVHDVAKAVMTTIAAPGRAVAGRVFNVGSDEQNHTLAEVAAHVQGIVPGSTIVDRGANTDKRNYRVSFRAIREELGFTPDWTLDEGIEQVAAALRSREVVDYRMPIYSNVQFLTDEGLSKLVRRELLGALDALDAAQSEIKA